MPNMHWDIETRSAANLRDCGAHVYAIDPTTQPLCLVSRSTTAIRSCGCPTILCTHGLPPAIFSRRPSGLGSGRAPL